MQILLKILFMQIRLNTLNYDADFSERFFGLRITERTFNSNFTEQILIQILPELEVDLNFY